MNTRCLHRLTLIHVGWILLITAMLLSGWGNALAEAQTETEKPIYIVVMKQGPEALAMAQELGQKLSALHQYRAVFPGFAAELNESALAALSRNPQVEFIEQAHEVKAYDEAYPSGVDRIDADLAHMAVSPALGAGARVAIVDTGIDFTHEDLAGQVDVVLSSTFITRGKTTEDGFDDGGHGTHVAGTVAAILDATKGVVGVAPSASLVSLKVLSKSGTGSSSTIIAALEFITSHNNAAASYADMIHVANFSLGGSGTDIDSAYRRAYEAAVASGCFIVVAAGNETDDAANHVPAAYDTVFTVSATNPLTGAFAGFSNFGPDIDIAAPGVNILSTLLGGGYGNNSGTSMASPHVAGAAALYVGQHLTTLTKDTAIAEIRNALILSGEVTTMAGDKDGIPEPLVDAEAVVGAISTPDPAWHLSVITDQPSYLPSDSLAVLSATVTDETGSPVTDLVGTNFTSDSHLLTFVSETGAGTGIYTLDHDISTFPLGDTDVSITVTDASGALSDSDTVTIRKAEPATMFVSLVEHEKVFKNLRIYVTVKSTDGSLVTGATVDITVRNEGGSVRNYSNSTGTSGLTSFRWANAPSGDYRVEVVDIFKDGMNYASSLNTSDGFSFTIP